MLDHYVGRCLVPSSWKARIKAVAHEQVKCQDEGLILSRVSVRTNILPVLNQEYDMEAYSHRAQSIHKVANGGRR